MPLKEKMMMNKLMSLTKRNCMVFLKDKGAVFFSLLSMIIVLVLMGVFLGQMNVNSVTGILAEYGGVRDLAADEENAKQLVNYWTLAGLVVVNSLTVTLSVIGTMVSDRISNKNKSFYTAPVSKFTVAISYIISAIIIGFFFCMITCLGYMGYIWLIGGQILSVSAIFKVTGLTLINVSLFSIIMFFPATFINSSNAWGGIATVVGTLVGFFGAIYIPVGALPESVVNILKCFPILHATSLMRKVVCQDVLECTFEGLNEKVVEIYRGEMGIDVLFDSKPVSSEVSLLFLAICGIIALVAILLVTKRNSEEV